jgi:hypothetical protein
VPLPKTDTVPETTKRFALVVMVQCNVLEQFDRRSKRIGQNKLVAGLGYGADRVTAGQPEGTFVDVAVKVGVAVTVEVAVPVRVAVQVTVTVEVTDGVKVAVGLGVEVDVEENVAVQVAVTVGVGLNVGVPVNV